MKNINHLNNHKSGIWTCDYSNISPSFITGSSDKSIIMWDTNSYKPTSVINYHEHNVYDVRFSESGNYFASCSKGKVCLWDVKKLDKPMFVIKGIFAYKTKSLIYV